MYLFLERALDESHDPVDHVVLHECGDDCVLYRAFLKQSQAKSLDH